MEFENLKSVKLNSIVEESNTELVVIYKVEYELKNKKDGVSSQDSGKGILNFQSYILESISTSQIALAAVIPAITILLLTSITLTKIPMYIANLLI